MTTLIIVLAILCLAFYIIYRSRGFSYSTPADSKWVARTRVKEKHLTVNDLDLRILDIGKGTPILLLHGWSDSTYTWREIIPRLEDKYRLIALDFPGFGFSEKPAKIKSYEELAETAIGVMDELKLKKAYVVGNSMGGATSVMMAANYPERINGIIPIDAHTMIPLAGAGGFGARMFLDEKIGNFVTQLIGRIMFRLGISALVFDKRLVTDEVVNEMYLPFSSAGGRHSFINQFREITLNPVSWKIAKKVKVPTFIIWGRRDFLVPLRFGKYLHECIDSSNMTTLEDTGHLPQWERPNQVAEIIDEFITSLEKARKRAKRKRKIKQSL